MKKKLNEAEVANELRGASLFFPQASPPDEEEALEPKPRQRAVSRKKAALLDSAVAEPAAAPAEQKETDEPVPAMTVSPPELPSAELGYDQLVEGIRKAVKQLGKEATFCRFTQEEKNVLGDIVYTYKRNGIRTSENEIIRIAVNWLIENYRADERNSVLAQVLDKLNA